MIKYVKRIKKENWKMLSNFYKKQYGKNHIITKKKFLFWQFGNKKYLNIRCLLKDNKLIACIGIIKLPYKIKRKKIFSIWLSYWKSDKKYQGSGLFLLKKVLSECQNVFTINVSNYGKYFYKILKFESVNYLKRSVIIFKKKEATKLLIEKKNSKRLNFHMFDPGRHNNNIKINFINLKKLKYNSKNYNNLGNHVIRDKKYLIWRYTQHPYFNYKFAVQGSGKNQSICIFREEKYFGFTKGKAIRIIDILFSKDNKGEKNLKILLLNFLNYYRNKNFVFADFYSNNTKLLNVLNSFKVRKKFFNESLIANRLTPVKIEKYTQNLYYSSKIQIKKADMNFGKCDVDGDIAYIN